ncbi:MAG: serine/threonine protein kinase [Vicinamibacterales bacterium]|nr:serine/threonine protein kinase [Vicinamibacterales bacterium]
MPEAIAHYKILDQLGTGGLGDVYRARDTRLGRTVAVKVLPPWIAGDPARLADLLNTVKPLAALSHPNIAMLFESGEDGDRRYLVFEFVQGDPLGKILKERGLNVRRALEFATNLADALADAHGVDVVHGDIRPDTIMITPKDRAKFVNFGLSAFTGGGAQRVSPPTPYTAPEELTGQPPDPRSDIYALGAVLFEMLTGRQRARGVVLSGLNPNVPPELDQLVARMLAANVESRAQSAATIAAELRSITAALDARAEEDEMSFEPPRRTGRRLRSILTAALLAFAIVALVFWLWRTQPWRLLS